MSALFTIAYFAVAIYAWPWFAVAIIRDGDDGTMRGDKPWEFLVVGLAFVIALFWPLALLIVWMRRRVLRILKQDQQAEIQNFVRPKW